MATKPHTFTTRQKMRTNTFEVFHYKDTHMTEVALHHHDFYEVYFFLAGNVSYNIESRSYFLTSGDVLLIAPNELHQPIFSPEQQNYERIVLWLNKSFLEQFDMPGNPVSRCFDTADPSHINLIRPDGNSREMLYYLMMQLLSESQSGAYASELYSMASLAQILVILNRLSQTADGTQEAKINADSVIYRVLAYINEHFYEEISLDDLTNRFFISKFHLSREFNRVVGTSVYRYIIQKRLILAKQMMGNGVPSGEVYQHCGFGDYSNFYRAFRAEYQISPKDYIASLKAEEKMSSRRIQSAPGDGSGK